MPGPSDKFFDWLAQRGGEEEAAPTAATPPIAPPGGAARRVVVAAVGLAIAGAAAPIAVSAVAGTSGFLGPPLFTSALVALLILAPAGVALAVALSGLRRIAAALAAPGDREAEHAVLRVFAGTLTFGAALGLAAVTPGEAGAPVYLTVAALGLATSWALLLHVILWPLAPPMRRGAAMALDIVLLSAFLHFGGRTVAGWVPLYFAAIFYAGFRYGLGALVGNTVAAILGFAAVVASTEFWRQEPGLAAGLLVALAALPALVAGMIHALAAAQVAAAAAEADRRGVLRLIADNLRAALAPLAAAPAAASELPDTTEASARAVAARIGDVVEFAALEADGFAAPAEAFDPRALIKHVLSPLRADAAERGVALRWRVDAHLPLRLRGDAEALARIAESLAAEAVAATSAGTVRVALDATAGDARRIKLHLRLDAPALVEDLPAVRLAARLAARIGGQLAIDRPFGRRTRLTLTLTLAIEADAPDPLPDFGGGPALIATEDGELAAVLMEMLAAWRGDPRWVADGDAALAELVQLDPADRAVAIVDGRDRLLSALSFAHHAARLGPDAPFVILIAEPVQIDSLSGFNEAGFDGCIPVPVTERLLAGVLDALPLGPDRAATPHLAGPPRPLAERRGPAGDAAEHAAGRVTPLAAHPRFAPETAEAVDARVIEGLRALGGGPGFTGFLGDLIEGFRAEARQLMERIREAVAAGDVAGFGRCLAALRRTAGPLGGTQLCELLASLQCLTAGELRQRGALHVQRLDAEIDRLAAALLDFLPASEARRP
ncbi:MAG TPA: hypothetical protein VGQ90_15070 [Stellaceae bacterium]|nr:hypothetical protein [Stellaceae bacterium]